MAEGTCTQKKGMQVPSRLETLWLSKVGLQDMTGSGMVREGEARSQVTLGTMSRCLELFCILVMRKLMIGSFPKIGLGCIFQSHLFFQKLTTLQ